MKDRQNPPSLITSLRNRLRSALNLSSAFQSLHSSSAPAFPSAISAPNSSQSMDTFYISHGSPMLPLEDIPARDFLRKWPEILPEKPKAILAISAHWNTKHPAVSTTPQNGTIHDFYGFPPDLYKVSPSIVSSLPKMVSELERLISKSAECGSFKLWIMVSGYSLKLTPIVRGILQLQYNSPGAPELAKEVKDCLLAAGFPRVDEDPKRGLDHGAWVPLYLMYPNADIPVCQLSVQPYADGAWHYRLGQALQSLRSKGILIMASGSATHNLRTIVPGGAPTPSWMEAFDDWLNDSLVNGRFDEVIDFERKAPNARKVHPSPEHFYPLLVALGAAGADCKAERIHASWAHSTLSMANFAFRAAS